MNDSPPNIYHVVFLMHVTPRSLLILLLPIFWGLSSQVVFATETPDDILCCQCHNNVCADTLNKKNVHPPFQNLQCSFCHVYDVTDVMEETRNEKKGKVPESVVVNIPNHLPMRSKDEISISVCVKCHVKFTHNGHHPVNIPPPENVTIPDNFSLSSDGNITCISCHANHASDYEYRQSYNYKNGNIKSGYYADVNTAKTKGGCFICHADKGVPPENR